MKRSLSFLFNTCANVRYISYMCIFIYSQMFFWLMYLGQTRIYVWKLDMTLNRYIYNCTYRQVYDTLKSSSDRRTVEPWFADNNDIGETCMTLSQLMYSFSVNSKNSVSARQNQRQRKLIRAKMYDKKILYPILNILGVSHTPIPQTISLTVFFLNLYAYYTVSYIILVK